MIANLNDKYTILLVSIIPLELELFMMYVEEGLLLSLIYTFHG